jgi:hypothetical protein
LRLALGATENQPVADFHLRGEGYKWRPRNSRFEFDLALGFLEKLMEEGKSYGTRVARSELV